ncbi:putative bifunctional diguanylate cyclase/phosphodiesterase [Halomonas alkalisoli]|uniref:putative bifunctional diguanylate cyclase/phosphodiesterase n=1 Tax=Halomonas alkalisoli TaxID=2907158 RepID=UPI001F3A83C4|nr:EAL domain-containing protein [Halomonas alkalisoli]MCE9680878.1 EAL domain-containing protein [Halomonas alkalisoli]
MLAVMCSGDEVSSSIGKVKHMTAPSMRILRVDWNALRLISLERFMAETPDTNELFTDLAEALGMAFSMVCVAVIVKDGNSPGYLTGDSDAAQLLLTLDGVQATLADGNPRTEVPPPGTALAAAAFIAIEPLSLPHQQEQTTVIAFAGRHLKDAERVVALMHSLATETANELMVLRKAPFLAAAFAAIECGVTIADPSLEDTPLIYANAAFERMTGYPRAEILGRNCRFLQGDLQDQPGVRILRNALARGTDCTVIVTNFRRNGETFENRLKLRTIRTPDGTISHIIGIQLDVTKERSALESLARQKRRYESLIEAQTGLIWLMNAEGELMEVPEKWLEMAGLSSSSVPADLAAIRGALSPEAAEAFRDGWVEALRNVMPFEVIYHLPAQSLSPRWFLDRVTPVLDEENKLLEWIAASQEITELKRAEKEIERAAYEDRLTGLLSPEGFAQRLDERLKRMDLHPASPVVVVDIKALREINNTQGYDAGDEVLREVARRLTAEVGENGLIARTGGDEFTVLAPLENQRTPRQLRKCMAAVFDVPFEIRGFSFHVEASFGYARIRSSAGDARKLMNDAALAMHRSQHNPALTWTQYTKALDHQTRETVNLTTKLRYALEADQLELYYQPQVDLASGRIVSAEALLRWNHPQAGFIPPDKFIPLAEQSQLIGPIGDWVLRRACRDLRAWRDAGLPVTPISINLSLIQFQLGSVPDKVRQALTDYNVAPEELTLEITESVFEHQGQALKQDLETLTAMGVRLSLDDFGTGYSSLAHLNDYFFDEIKIDKSFVSQLDKGPYAQAIVKAVVVIAGAIGADVVAEGIEWSSHITTVLDLGCTKGQGFHFSRPVPEPRWRQLLLDQKALP